MTRLLPLVLLLAAPAVAAPVPKVVLTAEQEKEFDELWDKAYRRAEGRAQLYCRLIKQPDAAIEYLTRTVKPAKLTEKEAKELIAALGSNDETTWKRAYRDLRLRDVRLAMTLDDAWALAKTDESKLRLGHLLIGYGNFEHDTKSIELQPPRKPGGPKVLFSTNKNPHHANGVSDAPQTFDGWMVSLKERNHETDPRVRVAFAALARIGTAPARDHLRTLANDGHAKAWTTTESLAALDLLTEPKLPAVGLADLWVQPLSQFCELPSVNEFLDRPDAAVKFLAERLRPVKLTREEAKQLLAQLFSDDLDKVREAFRELDLVDVRLVMPMSEAWKEAKTATHRCRLVASLWTWNRYPKREIGDDDPDAQDLLFDYDYVEDKRYGHWIAQGKWRDDVPEAVRKRQQRHPSGGDAIGESAKHLYPDRWYRENTTIAILDAIGTDDAIAVIKDMATGHPDAGPTKAAKDVLKRRGVK